MSVATLTHAAPISLWRIAQHFITTLFNLFGAPEQIAADEFLTPQTHAKLSDWLRAGEAFLRRLLLIEAAALTPNISKPVLGRRKIRRVRKLMSFIAAEPEKWRVSFRCFVSKKIPNQERRCTVERKAEPARFFSAWPLAERVEALLRVFNNPAPYAQRLANTLYKRPHQAHTLLEIPERATHYIAEEDFVETEPHAEQALRRIDPRHIAARPIEPG